MRHAYFVNIATVLVVSYIGPVEGMLFDPDSFKIVVITSDEEGNLGYTRADRVKILSTKEKINLGYEWIPGDRL